MTLNVPNKGHRMHAYIHSLGYMFKQENGVWISSDDVAVQAIIDAFDPIAAALPEKIAAVKAEAQKRIFAILPAWKQSNLMAQALNDIIDHGTDATAWPVPEKTTKAAADAAWDKIKAIRAASDAIEAKLVALTKWQDLEAHDATTDVDWPE